MTHELVLSGNRVLAHGEAGCFLTMGGTVICESKGKAYQNATITIHEGGLPADIDTVGYEYRAGVFVPCAPYGVGNGNVAVVCNDDCKAIKDSGISVFTMGCATKTSYTGTGVAGPSNPNILTFPFVPYMVHIQRREKNSNSYAQALFVCNRFVYKKEDNTKELASQAMESATVTGTTLEWYGSNLDSAAYANSQMNEQGVVYDVFAIGLKEA